MPSESFIFLLAAFSLAFPFVKTMNQCLGQMAPECRRINPAQLWLNLIPVFNVYWVFVTADRFKRSMAAEKRRRPAVADPIKQDKGLLTAFLFAGFILSLPLELWNWLMFGAWVFALALYWKDIVLQMVWLMRHPLR